MQRGPWRPGLSGSHSPVPLLVVARAWLWRHVPGSSFSHVLILILTLHPHCDAIHIPCDSPIQSEQDSAAWVHSQLRAPPPEASRGHSAAQREISCPPAPGFPQPPPTQPPTTAVCLSHRFSCWTFTKTAAGSRRSFATSSFHQHDAWSSVRAGPHLPPVCGPAVLQGMDLPHFIFHQLMGYFYP